MGTTFHSLLRQEIEYVFHCPTFGCSSKRLSDGKGWSAGLMPWLEGDTYLSEVKEIDVSSKVFCGGPKPHITINAQNKQGRVSRLRNACANPKGSGWEGGADVLRRMEQMRS